MWTDQILDGAGGRLKLLLVSILLITAGLNPAVADIVREGKPAAEIVIGENPVRMTRFAAEELQTYIEKIGGARLSVVAVPSGEQPVKIYVGRSRFTDDLGLDPSPLQHGAYLVASGPDWLALLGNDREFHPVEPYGRDRSAAETSRLNAELDRISGGTFWNNFRNLYQVQHEDMGVWELDDLGTVNAVHQFLRDLGVRWFAPGADGEVVPQTATIVLPSPDKRVVTPDFPVRRLSFFYDHLKRPELTLWKIRLGTNRAPDLRGLTQPSHGIKFVLMRDEMKEAHPEIYALWGGERATDHKGGQGAPSLGSRLLKEKHLQYARAIFDHYREPLLSLDMVDGFSGRICDNDSHLATPERGFSGSMSDYVWGYIDAVARELYKSHPDRMVSGLIYGAYTQPPSLIDSLSPNIALIHTRHRSRMGNPQLRAEDRELRRAWLEILPSRQYFTRDYELHASNGRNRGLPVVYPRLIADDLRELKGVSLGEEVEAYEHRPSEREELGYDEFALSHLNVYVTSRLWWDADQDLAALLDDYYSAFYGPAAAPMREFLEHAEANWPAMGRDPNAIETSFALLATAAAAAPDDSPYARRIANITQLMQPLREHQQLLVEGRPDGPEFVAPQRDTSLLVFDGTLDGDLWRDVPFSEMVLVADGGEPAHPTEFAFVAGSDGNLYLGIRCKDPDLQNLEAPAAGDGDSAIWNGDFIELLIETPRHAYYQISVDPKGHLIDLERSTSFNDSWKSMVEVRTARAADGWTAVLRIPPAGEMAAEMDPNTGIAGDMPGAENPWYVNVGRARPRGVNREASAWSPTGGSFHKPRPAAQRAFGKLTVEETK